MKLLCLSLALLSIGGHLLAADDTAPIILDSVGVDLPESRWGKPFQWKVLPEAWRRTPSWTPGAGPVPLDAHAATMAALRWINAQPWAKRCQDVDEVDLRSYQGPSNPANQISMLWYYRISFDISGDVKNLLPHRAVVLLDGTVVEPTSPTPAHP